MRCEANGGLRTGRRQYRSSGAILGEKAMRPRAPILTQKRAKSLRRSLTQPERTLWSLLRRNRLGLHFRRQHAMGPYILDVYCAAAALCVEVDGPSHVDGAARDARRTEWLNEHGIRVARFSADEFEQRPAAVLAAIARAAAPPPPDGGPPSPATSSRERTQTDNSAPPYSIVQCCPE